MKNIALTLLLILGFNCNSNASGKNYKNQIQQDFDDCSTEQIVRQCEKEAGMDQFLEFAKNATKEGKKQLESRKFKKSALRYIYDNDHITKTLLNAFDEHKESKLEQQLVSYLPTLEAMQTCYDTYPTSAWTKHQNNKLRKAALQKCEEQAGKKDLLSAYLAAKIQNKAVYTGARALSLAYGIDDRIDNVIEKITEWGMEKQSKAINKVYGMVLAMEDCEKQYGDSDSKN